MTMQLRSRPAFTLLEMMVVISIIALLAAMTVSAVFRVQETQREQNTNHTLRKAHVGLEQQWKAAAFTISKERPTIEIEMLTSKDGTLANKDPVRARALHTKLRFRQEFPQAYDEARYVFKGVYGGLNNAYGQKKLYIAAIGAGNGQTPELEGAALLFVTLSHGRGGVNFNVEEIGPTALFDVGGKQMRVLMDEWGTPICMRRWATDDPIDANALAELNNPQYGFVTAEQLSFNRNDPDDPEGHLTIPNWGGPTNKFENVARTWFAEPLLPRQVNLFNPAFPSKNRGPYLVSAGKDKTFGTDDDLFSFRIQGSGKGN